MSNKDRRVLPGQIYRHFKGMMYQVITIAYHSETQEKLVVYQKLYGDYAVHARPYDMFISEVDHEKYPNVFQEYRFELVGNIYGEIESYNHDVSDNSMKKQSVQGAGNKNNSVQNVENTFLGKEISDESEKENNNISETEEIEHIEINNAQIKNAEIKNTQINNAQTKNAEVKNIQINNDETKGAEFIQAAVPECVEEEANPILLAFLDAETFEDKRGVLVNNHDKMTDRLIDDLAASMDVTVEEGPIDKRFASLMSCVNMRIKYEVTRFR